MRFLRENVAICGFADISTPGAFAEFGFDCQLQLVEGHDSWLRDKLDVLCIPFLDGLPIPPRRFTEGLEWLEKHWSDGDRILISCAAGESRSVSMAIALIARIEGTPFLTTASEVIANIPRAYPHPVTLASAMALSGCPRVDALALTQVYLKAHTPPQFPWPEDLIQLAIDRWHEYSVLE